MKKYPFLLILVFLILTSCQKEDEDCILPTVLLPLSSLEAEYSCEDTRYLRVKLSEEHMLIRSQEEFEEMLMGEGCRPAIDFSKYDLLLGE